MFELTLRILVQLPQASVSGECWAFNIAQRAEKRADHIIQDQESREYGDDHRHIIR